MAGETLIKPLQNTDDLIFNCTKLISKNTIHQGMRIFGEQTCCCGNKPYPEVTVASASAGDQITISFDTIFAAQTDLKSIKAWVSDGVGNIVVKQFDIDALTGVLTNSLVIDTTVLIPNAGDTEKDGYKLLLKFVWNDCDTIFKENYYLDHKQSIPLAQIYTDATVTFKPDNCS